MCLIGNTELLCMQCREIGPHLLVRRKSHGFLELLQKPGVYYRDTVVTAIQNSCLFSELSTPVELRWTAQESKLLSAGQYERFWR